MPVKIALDSFLAVAKRSNLVTKDQLTSLIEAFQREGNDTGSSKRFAEFLVRQKALTGWQAEKLLQGKHKGFFLGKYKLLALLGKGGMSSVYLAEHVLMRRRCAIKVLPTRRVHDASYLGRFHREAQAVAALDHPNIVRAYDVDHEVDGDMEIHFLVMEFVDGKSLLDTVQTDGPLPTAKAAEYIRQAALGLQHAHEAGLVHRDIKPGNLLVDRNGVVKVLDLGLARIFEATEDHSLTVQHDERVLGTADYLAPEQAVDSHGVDSRADVYGLGCTLYFCLTGHPPFTTGTLAQRLMAHQTKEPPPVEAERRDVSPGLAQILRKMMAKRPEDRYPTAAGVAQALAGWLQPQRDTEIASGPQPTPFPGRAVETSVKPAAAVKPSIGPAARRPAAAPAVAKAAPRGVAAQAAPAIPADVEPEIGAFLWRLNVESTGDMPIYSPDGSDSAIVSSATRRKVLGEDGAVVPPASAPFEDVFRMDEAAAVAKEVARRGDAPAPAVVSPAAGIETLESALADTAPTGTSSVIRRRAKQNYTLWAYLAAAGTFVLVAAIVFFATRGNGARQTSNAGGSQAPLTPPGDQDPPPPKVRDDLGPSLRVGPKGDFASVSAALKYVEEHAARFTGDQTWKVTLAGGQTYKDRIVLIGSSFGGIPKGVRIESEGPSPAILQPDGADPVVDLDRTEQLTISGLVIDAGGHDAAIVLSGNLNGTVLENLTVRGFARTGIVSDDLSGNLSSRVQLRGLTFVPGSRDATGIRLADARNLRVDGCQFAGMQTGIEFTSTTWNHYIEVRHCRFHELRNGVRFSAMAQPLEDVQFVNNTFHRVQRGIAFDRMPASGSGGLIVRHNLFVGVDPGPEAIVEQGLDSADAAGLLAPEAARHNWSDRKSEAVQAGELDIFAQDGRRGMETVPFASRDPSFPDFLKPATPAVRNDLQGPAQNADPYVGAIAP
jgi:serine/threonine-protein kinase